jgi:hypothetical protein
MNRWHGKHPVPWDFFNTYNNVTGKNLNWFWNNWFFTGGWINIGIDSVITSATNYAVAIVNKGGFAIPFDVIINYSDGSNDIQHYTPEVWQQNQKNIILNLKPARQVRSINLKTGIYMDSNETDNEWLAK